MTYFSAIGKGISTTLKGMRITLKHLWEARNGKGAMNIGDEAFFQVPNGHVTLQYPHEEIEVPDHGRYQLDNEIEDCIVCDKCAKICPVDCIDIEAVKSPELIRHASDGSPVRLHAAKFDIDMAKCCFCGLCTTVCPTECLTMNSEYDYSTVDVTDLNFAFSHLSEKEAAEKKSLYEQFIAEKAALKAEKQEAEAKKDVSDGSGFKPSQKPKQRSMPSFVPQKQVKPTPPIFTPGQKPKSEGQNIKPTKKPSFKPSMKPTESAADAKPSFKPSMKPKEGAADAKPSFKPSMKPSEGAADAKPSFKPSMKPTEGAADAKPSFKPSMKPTEGAADAKPSFKPSMKPKEGAADAKPSFKPSMKPSEGAADAKPSFKPSMKPKNGDNESVPKKNKTLKPPTKPRK